MGRRAVRIATVVAMVALLLSCGSGSDDSSGDSGDDANGSVDSGTVDPGTVDPGTVDPGSEAMIDAGGVAAQVTTNLTELGLAPEAVVCPDDLLAQVGRTSRCEITLEGTSWGVTVEVASTDDDQATLEVTVDDQPG